jgi:hypothetical protein
MNWSFRRLNLKWYQYFWALLPLGLASVGGAIGGACGGAASICNLKLMRGDRSWRRKYLLTALVSLISVGGYIWLSRVFVITIGSGTIASMRVDHELENSPIIGAIRKADPMTFQKIRGAMIKAAAQNEQPAEINTAAQPYVTMMTSRYLPFASDTAILDFTRIMTLEVDQIGAKDVDACIAFLSPSLTASAAATSLLTPELRQRDVAATAAVIESGSKAARPVPTRSDVSGALTRVARQMVVEFGGDDVAALAKSKTLNHRKVCTMTSALYKDALTLPIADAVPLLRFLYAQKTAI